MIAYRFTHTLPGGNSASFLTCPRRFVDAHARTHTPPSLRGSAPASRVPSACTRAIMECPALLLISLPCLTLNIVREICSTAESSNVGSISTEPLDAPVSKPPTMKRGADTACCGSNPLRARRINWVWICDCAFPPHGRMRGDRTIGPLHDHRNERVRGSLSDFDSIG